MALRHSLVLSCYSRSAEYPDTKDKRANAIRFFLGRRPWVCGELSIGIEITRRTFPFYTSAPAPVARTATPPPTHPTRKIYGYVHGGWEGSGSLGASPDVAAPPPRSPLNISINLACGGGWVVGLWCAPQERERWCRKAESRGRSDGQNTFV